MTALVEARASREVERRKVALLAQPLSSASGGEGYLAGYLMVRNLWRFLGNFDERFQKPDLFLLFAYQFFYEDDATVAVLLDHTKAAPDSITSIFGHLWDRFERAFASEATSALGQFHERLSSARREARDQGELFPLSDAMDVDPVKRFLAEWDRVIGIDPRQLPSAGPSSWERSLRVAVVYHGVAHSRDLLALGSLPVRVEVTGEMARVLLDGHELIALPAVADAPKGLHSGFVNLCLGIRTGSHIIYVSGDIAQVRRLIALQATPPPAEASKNDLLRSILGREMLPAADLEMRAVAEEIDELREFTRIPGYIEQTRQRLDALYFPFALMYVPEPLLGDAVTKMSEDGMYGLFGGDAELVRALAIVARPPTFFMFRGKL